ncbi:MAG: immune inhibitor A, partial [bacterium]|nr:immune inhibitor A [bacterium]
MVRRLIVASLVVCSIFSIPKLMWGMPPREGLELPEEVRRAKLEGVIDSPDDPIRDAGKKGVINIPGYKSISLVSETKWMPCVLVYFTDQDSTYPLSDFQIQLFDTLGNWPTGSCYDYYNEISYGQLELKGNCFGWYSTGNTKNYYAYNSYGFDGPYPQNTAGLAMAAITATDSVVDYSKFDNDGDGYVDCLWVVHSGRGAEETGSSTDIWSHSTRLSYRTGVYTTNDPDPNHLGEYIKIDRYIMM